MRRFFSFSYGTSPIMIFVLLICPYFCLYNILSGSIFWLKNDFFNRKQYSFGSKLTRNLKDFSCLLFHFSIVLGLYTLGIYRKPGPQAAINNLKSVLTSVGKCHRIINVNLHTPTNLTSQQSRLLEKL